MADIVMPRLSDTMEEGTILRWFKSDGDQVRRGEELVEIETDKATMSYESDQDGVLQIVASEGDTLAVGELIARVGGADDEQLAGDSPEADDRPAADFPRTADLADAFAQTPSEQPASEDGAGATEPARASSATGRVKASPLARRVARESGVDLNSLTGSGPGGRIVKADVSAAGAVGAPVAAGGAAVAAAGGAGVAGAGAPTAAAHAPDAIATAKGETTIVELSRTQQTIARRMAESKATIPDFSLQMDVDMEECVQLRTELKRLALPREPAQADGSSEAAVPTYNDMVVKACALALRAHPRVNASYRDGRLQSYSRVNVGVAVAAENALVVPTVFDADSKALGEIARETRALAGRVRGATITPPELGGGTFTVSNLGMYGIRSFSAIINPPQAAILSVGSVESRAVARVGALVPRHVMTLTLVCDHRILYGADAAEFLARIRELLEAPAALTL